MVGNAIGIAIGGATSSELRESVFIGARVQSVRDTVTVAVGIRAPRIAVGSRVEWTSIVTIEHAVAVAVAGRTPIFRETRARATSIVVVDNAIAVIVVVRHRHRRPMSVPTGRLHGKKHRVGGDR